MLAKGCLIRNVYVTIDFEKKKIKLKFNFFRLYMNFSVRCGRKVSTVLIRAEYYPFGNYYTLVMGVMIATVDS